MLETDCTAVCENGIKMMRGYGGKSGLKGHSATF